MTGRRENTTDIGFMAGSVSLDRLIIFAVAASDDQSRTASAAAAAVVVVM